MLHLILSASDFESDSDTPHTQYEFTQVNYEEYAKEPGKAIYADKVVYYGHLNKQNFNPKKVVFMFYGMVEKPEEAFQYHPPADFFKEDVLYVLPQGTHQLEVWGPFYIPSILWVRFTLSELQDLQKNKMDINNPKLIERMQADLISNRRFLFQLINDVQKGFDIPWENIFLTGYSLGGIQAYDLFVNHSHLKYAAIISGVMDLKLQISQKGKTLLSIYSECDETVPAELSKQSEEQFNKLGGKVISVTNPLCGHGGTPSIAYRKNSIVWHFFQDSENFDPSLSDNDYGLLQLRRLETSPESVAAAASSE